MVLILWSLGLELGLRLAFGILRWALILCGASSQAVDNLMWTLNEVLLMRQFLIMLCNDPSLMDDVFVRSLQFVDLTNQRKHPNDDIRLYSPTITKKEIEFAGTMRRSSAERLARRFLKRTLYFVGIGALSRIPRAGILVVPLIAFQSMQSYIGSDASIGVFLFAMILPQHYFMVLLAVMNGSRALMNDLLRPYFTRLPFEPSSKRLWLQNRQAVLIGFGFAFYLLSRLPYVGLLVYGFASAATAYLVTKVTDPPPENPMEMGVWTQQQSLWTKPIYD